MPLLVEERVAFGQSGLDLLAVRQILLGFGQQGAERRGSRKFSAGRAQGGDGFIHPAGLEEGIGRRYFLTDLFVVFVFFPGSL